MNSRTTSGSFRLRVDSRTFVWIRGLVALALEVSRDRWCHLTDSRGLLTQCSVPTLRDVLSAGRDLFRPVWGRSGQRILDPTLRPATRPLFLLGVPFPSEKEPLDVTNVLPFPTFGGCHGVDPDSRPHGWERASFVLGTGLSFGGVWEC